MDHRWGESRRAKESAILASTASAAAPASNSAGEKKKNDYRSPSFDELNQPGNANPLEDS